VLASRLFDYDNDGLIDLLIWSTGGVRLFRGLGGRWEDVTEAAFPSGGGDAALAPASAHGVAMADLDGDGATDIVTAAGGNATWWPSAGGSARRSIRLQLRGRASNRFGVGAKVEVRAGSLVERVETSAATPAIAPADIVFGLGAHRGADVVRLLWPSGILQAESAPARGALPESLTIEELDRKPSSCPFLFTWNGRRFEFVTDFMGGGEMGYWHAPGVYGAPDPVEYVRIRADQLQARDGRFEVRVTNELEEVLFADRFELRAIEHPRDIQVFPDEGLTDPPKPFRLVAVRNLRPPARVVDDRGRSVADQVARMDDRYAEGFAVGPFRGYAEPHGLTIDLGAAGALDQPVLLLSGWTDYAFSSDNVAARQAGLLLTPPSLQVRDGRTGQWRTAVDQIGIPVGRPQTVVVDLASRLRHGEHEVRVVTNMRIYWDQILVGAAADARGLEGTVLDLQMARLRERGFSAPVQGRAPVPERYDYARVTPESPWKAMPGRYTRLGDVRPLLVRSDDAFVIVKPGDETVLVFEAAALGALPDGFARTFLLRADGFSKEMDIHSASPDVVAPLPFHGMTRYPYSAPEHYPDTPAHRDYRATYNTRIVARTVPTLVTPERAQGHAWTD
jgi:hypothetical protein